MTILVDLRPLMGGKISGVEIYIVNLLRQLLDIDRTNQYILFTNSLQPQRGLLSDFIHYQNVTLVQTRIPNKILNLSLALFRRPRLDRLVLRALRLSRGRIDLFFMPDLRLSALSPGVKKVTTVHDLAFHHFPHFFSIKTRLWYRLLRPKREIFSSDRVIAVSNATAFDLHTTYEVPTQKIEVIYEGVEPDFSATQLDIEACKMKYGLPSRYFLSLSTHEPRKNLVRLVEAFFEFKRSNPGSDLQLVLAGREQKIFSKFDLSKFLRDPLSGEVLFPGFIAEEDKAAMMKGAEAFLYPSLFEGFGLPLVEALKVGVPIITSSASSMPEIVGDAALLINPLNSQEIAMAMKESLKPEVRIRLQESMRERVKLFRWSHCAQKTLEVFESLNSA